VRESLITPEVNLRVFNGYSWFPCEYDIHSLESKVNMMELSLPTARAAFPQIPAVEAGAIEIKESAPESLAKQSRWILNGPLDLFFVCGGAMWLLLIVCTVADVLGSHVGYAFSSFVLLSGALVFADSHNAATIVRFIDEPGLAARHPYVSILLPLLMVALLLPQILGNPQHLEIAVQAYLILIAQHVTAQAYGITMIYLRKSGLELSTRQVQVIKMAFTAMMISGIARQLSPGTSSFMGGQLSHLEIVPGFVAFAVGFAACIFFVIMFGMLSRQAHKSGVRLHPGAMLLAVNTLLLYTIVPAVGLLALLAPAFFHGTQYLAVTTAHAMKSHPNDLAASAPAVVASKLFTGDNVFYWTKVLSLGAVLYMVIPMLLSKLGFSATTAMAAVFCTVNFHHFVADAVIWRRRNPNLNNQQSTINKCLPNRGN
jgi:hypothetical protein